MWPWAMIEAVCYCIDSHTTTTPNTPTPALEHDGEGMTVKKERKKESRKIFIAAINLFGTFL